MFIIAGLGNPGTKYHGSRHNIGFYVIDILAQAHGIKVNKIKHKALIGRGQLQVKGLYLQSPKPI